MNSMTIPTFKKDKDWENQKTLEKKLESETSHMERAPKEVATPPPSPRTSNNTDFNTKNLFGETLRSDRDRLDRLERAMQDMRNDFDGVSPSIRRLMAVEKDIQNLLVELRKLSEQPTLIQQQQQQQQQQPPPQQSSYVPPVPAPAAKAPSKTKSPPPVTGGQATIYDVRIGEHPDKTRIVLDSNAKTAFSIDIDNNEKIMVVDLPQAKWTASSAQTLRSKTLGSYRVEETQSGSLLIFQLKKNARIVSQNDIAGASGQGHRIVIDLR